MLIVPPSGFSELLPLVCRSPSKLIRNDCSAAVPDEFDVFELVPAVADVAALEAAAGAAVVAGVEVADELPPRALINWLKALLRFAIAFVGKFEAVVFVTI